MVMDRRVPLTIRQNGQGQTTLLDKTKSVTTDNTTAALSHLAFCALAALGMARQDGIVGTPYAENLFLIRWLATAQKQKRFPRSVAVDIAWLLERGRKHGPAGKLRQQLEYLWRSCSGNLAAQSDLFRLTYATETLKDRGWDNYVMDAREWRSETTPTPSQHNGFTSKKRRSMPLSLRMAITCSQSLFALSAMLIRSFRSWQSMDCRPALQTASRHIKR